MGIGVNWNISGWFCQWNYSNIWYIDSTTCLFHTNKWILNMSEQTVLPKVVKSSDKIWVAYQIDCESVIHVEHNNNHFPPWIFNFSYKKKEKKKRGCWRLEVEGK